MHSSVAPAVASDSDRRTGDLAGGTDRGEGAVSARPSGGRGPAVPEVGRCALGRSSRTLAAPHSAQLTILMFEPKILC